jgi:hypothetical protein
MTAIKSNVLDAMRHPRTVTRDSVKAWTPQHPGAQPELNVTQKATPDRRGTPVAQGLHAAFGAPVVDKRG